MSIKPCDRNWALAPLFQMQWVNPDVLAKLQTIAKLVSEEGVAA
jgi:hypothetical protein